MALNLAAVMNAAAVRLDTISNLRVHAYPVEVVNVPAAIVSMPNTIDFDATAARGFDRTVIPILLLVSMQSMRIARDDISALITAAKAALEKDLGGACDSCRVMNATFEKVTVNGVDYLGANLPLEVYA